MTPTQKVVLHQGFAGFINTNVMHMRKVLDPNDDVVQLIHIFEPRLIASPGSRIEQRYVLPILTTPATEVMIFSPEQPSHQTVIEKIRDAFTLSNNEFGYEISLRNALSEIWMETFRLFRQTHESTNRTSALRADEKLKLMITFIYENFQNKIQITDIAQAAFLSERECFRLFRQTLDCSPMEYLKNYRIQKACEILRTQPEYNISQIAYSCGFPNVSYFSWVFKKLFALSPSEYRSKKSEY